MILLLQINNSTQARMKPFNIQNLNGLNGEESREASPASTIVLSDDSQSSSTISTITLSSDEDQMDPDQVWEPLHN